MARIMLATRIISMRKTKITKKGNVGTVNTRIVEPDRNTRMKKTKIE